MFMTTAFLHRRVSIIDVAKNWIVSYFGNLAGSLFFMAIITGYGGVFQEAEAYTHAAVNLATQKAYTPHWHQIFLRGIGANWLVCFAVFISISSREVSSKIIAIWWPTATFVALALDHVIANMFFIPLGIWCGAPFGVGYYIWKSMIPTLIGNMIGGGLFVGATYWYLYLTGDDGVSVDFNTGSLATAMEAGGPMRRTRTEQDHGNGTIIGQDPTEQLSPQPTGHMMSGLGKELADDSPYTLTHADRMKKSRDQATDEKV
ncbi:hypothetical protein LTR86_007931 [Recurvomyces mirabilis]|nr:hypothetical protein LTR86_007931 [Recurvomyces mirabilis]